MKTKFLFIGLMLSSLLLKAQDAIIYDQSNYGGTPHYLNIGQITTIMSSGNGALSIKILNANAGVKVEWAVPTGNYAEISFYTELAELPRMEGTNQYDTKSLKFSCFPRYLPQPPVFIPIDIINENPNVDNPNRSLTGTNPGDTVLMIRKANFWENSEDLNNNIFGEAPYGNLHILIDNPNVMNHTYADYVNDPSLFTADTNSVQYKNWNLDGAIWYNDMGLFNPSPYSEWIDNWWGAYYSNIALWDWDINSSLGASVCVVIMEADDGGHHDILGRALINKNMTGCMLIKCRIFGWVVLENIIAPSSGVEQSVDVAGSYLYLGWNGIKPEDYVGPNQSIGTQYEPFQTIAQVESQVPLGVTNGIYGNNIVGVLGDGIIAAPNHLTVPMTYVPAAPEICPYSYIFDWDGGTHVIGIDETSNENFEINVFPNPFKNSINVELNYQGKLDFQIDVYDVLGNLIKSIAVKSNKINIDLSEVSSGFYYMNLITEHNKFTKKLVKL